MTRSRRLIDRQLRKVGLDGASSPELQAFLARVEETYDEFEKHRQLTDHSTRLASEELALTMESLGASERLFRSLARCSPNGIIHTDIEGRCIYANERAQQLTGRSASELAGAGWTASLPPEDRGLFFDVAEVVEETPDRTVEHRVILGDGEVIWVSTVIAALIDSSGAATGWVANIEDITERKMHEQELSLLARTDSLTQLLNRHALRQRIDDLCANRTAESRLAIALIDLDRFKLVNDTFGHEVGDHLLIAVADLLRAAMPDHAAISRLGGDEFAVATMLEPGESPSSLGTALSEALNEPVDLGSRIVHLAASVGVAVGEGKSGTPTSLLRDADTAMYRAKRSTETSYEIFDESYREELTRRFVIESELRSAIQDDEIGLEYQPVFDSVTGKIHSIEAIARWVSPTLGQVPPAEFIPVVEDLGLMGILGTRLLNHSCERLSSWRTEIPDLTSMTVACKISPTQLRDPEFPGTVKTTLARNGLPGTALVLEVSEVGVLSDIQRTMGALDELRHLGITVTIDDFGTGYSSLSYLDRLPVDYLKIDKSFVKRMGEGDEFESSNQLTETIIRLALRFGLTPIAEGVETQQQGAILRKAGCELTQGYLLARPMPGDDPALTEILRNHNESAALPQYR